MNANQFTDGISHLVNIPFHPASVHQHDLNDPPIPNLIYTKIDSTPSSPKPTTPITDLDLSAGYPWGGVLKHTFAAHGPKARPVHIDVNGRKGRRAVCVLYGDSMRYEVLDLDAAMEEEEEKDEYSDEDEDVIDSDQEN
jgi:anaphase-promoting complex subunit 4